MNNFKNSKTFVDAILESNKHKFEYMTILETNNHRIVWHKISSNLRRDRFYARMINLFKYKNKLTQYSYLLK